MRQGKVGHEYPTLKNAPIVEALLDIQFSLLEPARLRDIEVLSDLLPEYPNKAPKIAFAGNIQVAESGASFTHDKNVIGYQFWNGENSRVFQARLNGMTLSFLKPYPKFAILEAEARRLWDILVSRLGGLDVRRIALRYINRIELPLPFDDFSELIKIYPEIPPDLPQGLTQFSSRVVLPDTESRSVAIVTEVMEEQTQPDPTACVLLFDIDVFQIKDAIEQEELWHIVQELREYKNRIFFRSITPRLQKVFDE